MQYHWLNKQNNKKLIVFFAGWSFDYKPFECLDCKDYDVLAIYDYNDLNLPTIDTREYQDKFLLAWSMGVFVAYLLKDKLPEFSKKIAINGTPYPIHNEFGIPKKTFELTLKYAESGLQGKFYQNVFTNDNFLNKYLKNPIERSIPNRVSELVYLNELIKNSQIEYDNKFYNKAIVGLSDKIIPTKNQLTFWGNIVETVDCGHFPFYNYKSWDELCN